MTRIEELHVDGFKGLTDTDLEFGRLNVVTGRNNTGKTSLLEAIELGLEPERLEGYGDQVGDLVNVHLDAALIELSLAKGQYSLSLEFASPEEALEHAINALVRTFSSTPLSFVPEDVDLSDAIERVLRAELANIEAEEVPDIDRHVLNVSYGGVTFRLVIVDGKLTEMLLKREDEIRASLESEFSNSELEEWHKQSPVDDVFDYVLTRRGPFHFAEFYLESPEGPNDVRFIEQPKTTSHPDSSDDENAAIKKVEIRDYLNEHEITPEPGVTVEDFDFDVIVFEEEGERYQVPYDFMGDGFKTIVGILWQFVGEEDVSDVVLMEEPENHMHPGYVGELVPFLVDVAREEDVQLFISTHNVDFISEFFAELPDDQREFLESEFRLVQMTETVPKTFDYADAKEQVEDLHLDLRGI